MSSLKVTAEWDFFVSYTRTDQSWAEWIAWVLEADGHRVLIQAWDFVAGANWIARMHDGVAKAARTIAVLSPAYLRSQYGTAEWQAAWAADPAGAKRKLLIVRVDPCERPGLLVGVVGVDLFDLDEAGARAAIRSMVADALSGRGKLKSLPPFPGERAITREPRFPRAMPRLFSNLPRRNQNFTGRAAELKMLSRKLTSLGSTAVVCVRGLDGVGKSQLVIEYAYEHAADYDLVCMISAERSAVITSQFRRLALQLGIKLESSLDTTSLREQVHAQLREVAGWMLIFDNVISVEEIRPWIPSALMPPRIPGHVLVTTPRHAGFADLGKALDMDPMSERDAVRMLRTQLPNIPKNLAHEIADELGKLPIALTQAATYVDGKGTDPHALLELLRKPLAGRHRRGSVLDSVTRLWDISLERIGNENPAAMQLMELCSYLAREPIPLDLFTEQAGLLPQPLAAAAIDPYDFGEVVGVLFDISLVSRTAGHLQIHRLVQDAVRTRYEDTQAIQGVGQPSAARACVAALFAASNPGHPEDPTAWPRWADILPHLLSLLAADHLPVMPAGLRPIAVDACRYMLAQGDAHGCAGLAENLHDPWLRRFGDDEWTLTIAIYRARASAEIESAAKEKNQIKDMAKATLAKLSEKLGGDHPLTLTAANDLAGYIRAGNPAAGEAEEALNLDRATLSRRLRILGENHPDALTSAKNVASDFNLLGKTMQAYKLDGETLASLREHLGQSHPLTLDVASNLASDLSELGDIEGNGGDAALARKYHKDALKLAEQTVDVRRKVQGSDHPATLRASVNLSANLASDGQVDAGLKLARETYARLLRLRGAGHESTLGCAINIVGILDLAGQAQEAKELAEKTLSLCREMLGADNTLTKACASELARLP